MRTGSTVFVLILLLSVNVDLFGCSIIFRGVSDVPQEGGYCSVPLGISRDSINIHVGFTVRPTILSQAEDGDRSHDLPERTYIQVEFNEARIITGILTQGSSSSSSRVTHFKITYSIDCVHFVDIISTDDQPDQGSDQPPLNEPVIYAANLEPNTTTTTMFDHVFSARCVRVVPTRRIGNETAMSFELLGCDESQCHTDLMSEEVSRGDNWQRFRFPVEKVLAEINIDFPLNPSQRPPGFVIAISRTCNFDFSPKFLVDAEGEKIFTPDEGSSQLVIDRSESPVRAQCVAINRIDPASPFHPRSRAPVERRRVPIQHAEGFDVTFKGCDALEPHEMLSGSCGKTRIQSGHKRRKRVVGGTPTVPGQWPWLVSLYYLKNHTYLENTGLKHLCGASLIHPQWVLTAAHCLHNSSGVGLDDKNNWLVVVGEHQQGHEDGTEQVIPVEKIILNPDYVFEENRAILYDIALMKLASPAVMSDYVNTICLEPNYTFPDFTSCVTAGWGYMKTDDIGGVELPNHATLQLLPQSMCEHRYHVLPDDHYAKPYVSIEDSVLCATESGKDSCAGDSGGPLICRHDDHWVQVGIVSIGFLCGDARYPGIYTKVNHYFDWIEDVMANN